LLNAFQARLPIVAQRLDVGRAAQPRDEGVIDVLGAIFGRRTILASRLDVMQMIRDRQFLGGLECQLRTDCPALQINPRNVGLAIQVGER